MLQHPLFIASVAVLILLGSWWFGDHTDEPQPQVPPELRDTADYLVHGMRVRTMDQDGAPNRILEARTLRHYAAQKRTELERPRLTIVQPGEPPWEVSAERGEVSPDGKEVLLAGAVRIARAASDSNRPVELLTRDLRVRPEQSFAETDEEVTVTSGASRITSVGMQAWFKHPTRFKFLSKVRGRHVPD